jgi:predicted CopG family antitoxin
MASKTISLREDAYERLAAQKREGESFTEVVLRMTAEEPRDFSNLVGADVDVSWDAIESARERSGADERRKALLRERMRDGSSNPNRLK